MSSSSVTCKNLTILTVLALVIQAAGLVLFLIGFFPVKSSLSGISGLEGFYPPGPEPNEGYNISDIPAQLQSLYQELSGVPPLFDRLILMVIDGLPAEFVLGKDGRPPSKELMEVMPYTQELLASGKAVGYHAKAAPPTVTMPRLKAMVSGAIGGFLDVAFNFNTQAMLDDNLIGQFFRIGWKMLMLGDDTWLKLFPEMFTRHDGVSSFFVKDTVQVDQNVSRHLSVELNRTDWNLLILHYLGLDHVGHIGGRNSFLMGPKLREMDEVIEMIDLSSIRTQNGNPGRTLLLIVSDHGMTENGNHGGSSFEETDALALFVGLSGYNYGSTTNNIANQVDIAPTLALLFGVPIPKNNVGFLMEEVFKALTDDEVLRLMQLNSWQLLRLLQMQLPQLEFRSFTCDSCQTDIESGTLRYGSTGEMFFCLYCDATSIHEAWKMEKITRSTGGEGCSNIILAYRKFLKASSEWLARRVTDRPVGLLALGLAAMALSCLMFLSLVILLVGETHVKEKLQVSPLNHVRKIWYLDEVLTVGIICFVMFSMGSSSMVEEEQLIWYFMTSSFYLVFLRKATQNVTTVTLPGFLTPVKTHCKRSSFQILCILVILCCGRLMRAWHRGGVNWSHLPDISKWFEQAEVTYLSSLRLASGIVLISTSIALLLWSTWQKRSFVMIVALMYLLPALLLLEHMIKRQSSDAMGYGATKMAQTFYAALGFSMVGTIIGVPWLLPVGRSTTFVTDAFVSECTTSQFHWKFLKEGVKDSAFVVGLGCIFGWCLLQLLLQQPVNSMPLTLLFIQILATIYYSSHSGVQLVEVAAIYYLGMAGHFGLGNTNTLATIDVAGAFTGVSSHSTFISGILMFIITYAAPMLSILSTMMYISVKDMDTDINIKNMDVGDMLKKNLGLPCLVPLCFNSMLLTTYTIVLLLMRNHLFIWSVFSPKYLYACATTVCVYVGVSVVALTMVYIHLVIVYRRL